MVSAAAPDSGDVTGVWYKQTQLLKYIIYTSFFFSSFFFFGQRTSSLHLKAFTPASRIKQTKRILSHLSSPSTHLGIALEKKVVFLQFWTKNKKSQCWSLEEVCGGLVNFSQSAVATAAPPRPLRTCGPRTSWPPARGAATGPPPSPPSLQGATWRQVRNGRKYRAAWQWVAGGLPWDLSMAWWWRFMGSTDVLMASPSASSRLLWVSASPGGADSGSFSTKYNVAGFFVLFCFFSMEKNESWLRFARSSCDLLLSASQFPDNRLSWKRLKGKKFQRDENFLQKKWKYTFVDFFSHRGKKVHLNVFETPWV